MIIDSIDFIDLEIPFRSSFKHSAAERSSTEAVIAKVTLRSGNVGYGEGCPRSYVTGESIESCKVFLEINKDSIVKLSSLSSLRKWVTENRKLIDLNPAAWCAIEIGILDAIGKSELLSLEEIIGTPVISGDFGYTAILGTSSAEVFKAQLRAYMDLGFLDYKLKISGDSELDRLNILSIQESMPLARIRVDANNLWVNACEAITYLKSLNYNIWAVEEPLKVDDYVGLAEIAEELGCKIILDECFLRIDQLQRLIDNPERWIPNIRVSKMGGILRSLEIAEECRRLGLKFILGAQVGETSILTRSALTIANSYRDILLAQEGAFGTYLLSKDIVKSPIMFQSLGLITDFKANGFGLGLEVTF